MTKPTTRIGTPTSDTDRFRMRGKDVLSEILGKKSFSETYYFIVTGKEPTSGEVIREISVIGRAAGLVAHIDEEKRNPVVPAVTSFANTIEYLESDQE